MISVAEFDEIQRFLQLARKGERRAAGEVLPLAGLVYCATCEARPWLTSTANQTGS
jgi:hypothetical protein